MRIQDQQRDQSRGREESKPRCVFRRYHLGWVLLSMAATVAAVFVARGGWGPMLILPLIVGALVFRSMLVADYKRRSMEGEDAGRSGNDQGLSKNGNE